MASSREERLRRELRARAWDLLARLPDDVGPGLERPVEAVAAEEGDEVEVVITVRRRRPAPPPAAAPAVPPGPPVVSIAPLQRFLPDCFLTDVEMAVVRHLLAAGRRETQARLLRRAEEVLARPVSEGQMKAMLARMTDPRVGILTNDRKARPPGYLVTAGYAEFLAWARAQHAAAQRPADVA